MISRIEKRSEVARQELEKARRGSYDGVSGILPRWVPAELVAPFEQARFALIYCFGDLDQAKAAFERYRISRRLQQIPQELKDEMDTLETYFRAMQIDDSHKALEAIAGPLAAKGAKFAAGRPEGSVGPFHTFLRDLCARIGSTAFNDVRRELLNLENLERAGTLAVDEVDDASRIVTFFFPNGSVKKVSFQTLRNQLTSIKKSYPGIPGLR